MLQQQCGDARDDCADPPRTARRSPGDGPTDPAEDTRTQPQKDFDDALASAREGLAAARTAANKAVETASAARTDLARTWAQTDIANARKALADAVNAAKALAELSSDLERLGERNVFVKAAEALQTEYETKLRAAELSTWWAGQDVAAREISPVAAVEAAHSLRNAGARLKASDIPPIMHEAGKVDTSGSRLI